MIKTIEEMVIVLNLMIKKIHQNQMNNACDCISEFVFYICQSKKIPCVLVIGEFVTHPNGEYHVWNDVGGIKIDMSVSQYGDYQNGILDEDFYQKNYNVFETEEPYLDKIKYKDKNHIFNVYKKTYKTLEKTYLLNKKEE